MSAGAELHVLRVFVDADGGAGNALGVFVDGAAIARERRQAVAAELGFSETVFVDDPQAGTIQIFTPAVELPFAGHPTVGTAWLLSQLGVAPGALRPPAGEVSFSTDGERTWVRARPQWSPPMTDLQLDSPEAVAALDGPPTGAPQLYVWAFENESAGRIRARFFAPGFGIAEDPATGSAAVLLCGKLGRPLRIDQQGSELLVRPAPDAGWVELGGRTLLDERREYRESRLDG